MFCNEFIRWNSWGLLKAVRHFTKRKRRVWISRNVPARGPKKSETWNLPTASADSNLWVVYDNVVHNTLDGFQTIYPRTYDMLRWRSEYYVDSRNICIFMMRTRRVKSPRFWFVWKKNIICIEKTCLPIWRRKAVYFFFLLSKSSRRSRDL